MQWGKHRIERHESKDHFEEERKQDGEEEDTENSECNLFFTKLLCRTTNQAGRVLFKVVIYLLFFSSRYISDLQNTFSIEIDLLCYLRGEHLQLIYVCHVLIYIIFN